MYQSSNFLCISIYKQEPHFYKTHKHLNNILHAMFSVELTTYICLYDIILNGFYREAFKMERAILCLLNVVSLLGKPQNDDS